ncbi:hypothetical protein [Plantactinospora sonchi]|uniref:Pilus assembly protein TadE n=1 Tax=Plantactinospora sonchi TaxID=1544735 RepID=A0ABU7S0I9_9ACTN
MVVFAILLLLVGAAGHTVLTMTTAPTIEERAHAEAVRRAALIGRTLVNGNAVDATALGQDVARNDRVDVMRVDGTDRRHSPGVRLLFRVHVEMSRPGMAGLTRTELAVCFRQTLDEERGDFSQLEVPCPPTASPTPPSSPVPR